jgi:hypothetical protein
LEDFQRILHLESRLHVEGRNLSTRHGQELLEVRDELSLDVRSHCEQESHEVIHVLRGDIRALEASRVIQVLQDDTNHGVHGLCRHELVVEQLADDDRLATLGLLELRPGNDGISLSRIRRRGNHNDVRGILERVEHLDLSLNILLHLRSRFGQTSNELGNDGCEEALLDAAVKQQRTDTKTEHIIASAQDRLRLLHILRQIDLGEFIDGRNDRLVVRIVLFTDLAMRILQCLLTPVIGERGRGVLAVVLLGLHVCRANLGNRSAAHAINDRHTSRGKGNQRTRAGSVDSCDLHDTHSPYIRK